MPARTKGRAKFDFRGRPFVWWVDGERWLRIASLDKKFVIAYSLLRNADEPSSLIVHGAEFPGLCPSEPRPAVVPIEAPTGDSMGRRVEQLLGACFDRLAETD